jgi:type I restriction enzyme S subunit
LERHAAVLTLDSVQEAIDANQTYQMAGVYSYARGLFYRGPQDGGATRYKIFHRVRNGQIVLSQLKAWEGAIALAHKESEGLFLPPHNACFSVSSSKADQRFIWWFLKQPSVWGQLRAGSRGMGARRDTVSINTFLSVQIALPPLNMQRRIVEQLDSVAAQLARRQAAAAAIEAELTAMLHAAFDRIIANAPRARMGEVAPLVRRQVDIDPEASYTEIGVKSFYRGIFHRRTLSGSEFTWQKLFRIHEGDLVFSNLMAWEQAIGIAAPHDHGSVGNHRMLTCEPDRTVCNPNFLWYFFTMPEGFSKILEASPGSIARNKTLSAVQLPKITVPIPSLDAQHWFDCLQTKVVAVRSSTLLPKQKPSNFFLRSSTALSRPNRHNNRRHDRGISFAYDARHGKQTAFQTEADYGELDSV